MRSTWLVIVYLAAIIAANLLVVAFGPGVSIINALLLVALDLTARDHLHALWHRRKLALKMTTLIAAGSLLSYLLNSNAGPIAIASLIAFAASSAVDTLTYAALRGRPYLLRVNGSNIAGALVDSLIFPILAFGWPPLWWVVAGQFVAKAIGGALWALVLEKVWAAIVMKRLASFPPVKFEEGSWK